MTDQGEARTPKQQPNTAPTPDVPTAAMALATVNIPRAVKADGKPLPAGTYQVRLTADEAKPDAVGTSGKLERWVEFVQKGSGQGTRSRLDRRKGDSKFVVKDTPPPAGGSKVQLLKGNDYLRVWIKQGRHAIPRAPRRRLGAGSTREGRAAAFSVSRL